MEEVTRGQDPKFMTPQGVTTGSVASVTKSEMLIELRNDVEAYKKALESAEKNYLNYKEQLDVDIAQWEILLKPGAIRKIVPERNYELDEKYWEASEKKQAFAIRQDRAIAEGQLKQLQNTVDNCKRALENATAKLKRFEE